MSEEKNHNWAMWLLKLEMLLWAAFYLHRKHLLSPRAKLALSSELQGLMLGLCRHQCPAHPKSSKSWSCSQLLQGKSWSCPHLLQGRPLSQLLQGRAWSSCQGGCTVLGLCPISVFMGRRAHGRGCWVLLQLLTAHLQPGKWGPGRIFSV